MQVTRFRAFPLIVSMTFLSSCSHERAPVRPVAMATPGQHWVQGERLKKVMEQIVGLHGAFPKGLPEDAESPAGLEARRKLVEAGAVSNALADAAQSIPTAIEGKAMSDADRRGFIAEAARLRVQALAFRDAAQANQIEPLQGMLDDLNATCISCHSRFRDISGALNAPRASASDRELKGFADNRVRG